MSTGYCNTQGLTSWCILCHDNLKMWYAQVLQLFWRERKYRTICNCNTFVIIKFTICFWTVICIGLSFRLTISTHYYAWLRRALEINSLLSHVALWKSRGWKLKATSHFSLGSTGYQDFTKMIHSYSNWNEVQSGTTSAFCFYWL